MTAMGSGRVNSRGSLETASRMLRSYNSNWAEVEKSATRDENGVYVVRRSSGAALSNREGSRRDRD
jgi:hypothetical protein